MNRNLYLIIFIFVYQIILATAFDLMYTHLAPLRGLPIRLSAPRSSSGGRFYRKVMLNLLGCRWNQ